MAKWPCSNTITMTIANPDEEGFCYDEVAAFVHDEKRF